MNLETWKLVAVFLAMLRSAQSSYEANHHVIAEPDNYDIEVSRLQNGDRWSIRNLIAVKCADFRLAAETKDSRICTCSVNYPHFFSKEGEEPGCYASREINHIDQSEYIFFYFICFQSYFSQRHFYAKTTIKHQKVVGKKNIRRAFKTNFH